MNARLAMEHVVATAQMYGTPILADERTRERLIRQLESRPDLLGPFFTFGQMIAKQEITVEQAIMLYQGGFA